MFAGIFGLYGPLCLGLIEMRYTVREPPAVFFLSSATNADVLAKDDDVAIRLLGNHPRIGNS